MFDKSKIGHSFPPFTIEVERGKIRELARAIGDDNPIYQSREAAQALGYKEMFDHLDGRASLAETVERIQTRSRQFAKRQVTWFRHLPNCRPVVTAEVMNLIPDTPPRPAPAR